MTNENTRKNTQTPEGFSHSDPHPVPVAVPAADRDSVHTHRRNRHPDAHHFLGFLNTKKLGIWSPRGSLGEHVAAEEVEEEEGRRDKIRILEKWLECLEMPRETAFVAKEGEGGNKRRWR